MYILNMTYRQNHISQKEAQRILNMTENEWASHIIIEDGNMKASTLNGVEIEIGWENPEIAIINHFWIDPKIRGEGIGTTMCMEVISQLKQVGRIESIFTSIQASNGATKYILNKCGFKNIKDYSKKEYDSNIIEGELQV